MHTWGPAIRTGWLALGTKVSMQKKCDGSDPWFKGSLVLILPPSDGKTGWHAERIDGRIFSLFCRPPAKGIRLLREIVLSFKHPLSVGIAVHSVPTFPPLSLSTTLSM